MARQLAIGADFQPPCRRPVAMMSASGNRISVAQGNRERAIPQINRHDVACKHVGAEPLGLRLHLDHEVGPMMPSRNPGQFSTIVVSISCPPASSPSISRGLRLARASTTPPSIRRDQTR